jgi:hypothetical protein
MSKKPENISDPVAHEKAVEAAKLRRDQQLNDIKAILSTAAGVRFFRRMMADAHVFHTSFTGNSATYFKEGERNLALRYFKDMVEAAPDKIVTLMKEGE